MLIEPVRLKNIGVKNHTGGSLNHASRKLDLAPPTSSKIINSTYPG